MERITESDFDAAGLDGWSWRDDTIVASFRASTYAGAGELVATIAAAADVDDHHPDLSLRWPGVVTIELTTHDAGGVSQLDLDLARTCSALAEQVGATASER